MPALVPDLLSLLRAHPLVRSLRVVHYPDVTTAPHHFHSEANEVSASPLCGDPLVDLPYVLAEIEKWMTGRKLGFATTSL